MGLHSSPVLGPRMGSVTYRCCAWPTGWCWRSAAAVAAARRDVYREHGRGRLRVRARGVRRADSRSEFQRVRGDPQRERSGAPRLFPVRPAVHRPDPLPFDAERNCLYAFSTIGQKIEWMRENPKVCLEVEELVDRDHRTSVLAIGRNEEVHQDPAEAEARVAQSSSPAAARVVASRRRETGIRPACERGRPATHIITDRAPGSPRLMRIRFTLLREIHDPGEFLTVLPSRS